MASCKKKCGQEQATSNHYPQKSICNLAAESLHWVSWGWFQILPLFWGRCSTWTNFLFLQVGWNTSTKGLIVSPQKIIWHMFVAPWSRSFQNTEVRAETNSDTESWWGFTFLIGHVSVQSPRHFFLGRWMLTLHLPKIRYVLLKAMNLFHAPETGDSKKGGLDKADKFSWWLLRR